MNSEISIHPESSGEGHLGKAVSIKPPLEAVQNFSSRLQDSARAHKRGAHIRAVAWKEFSDRFRSGWVIACVLLWLGAIGLTSLFGLVQVGRIGVQGYERTVMSLLNLVQYLVPLLALLLGHDLIVGEREDRTLAFVLASGVSRSSLMVGKFVGACLTVAVPLLLGFIVAGTAIGLAARDSAYAPFLRLALSGLALAICFVGVGILVSTVCRTRIQALTCALLVWFSAVFVFDLIALGFLISGKISVAAQEIELVCDATHINTLGDIHAQFDAALDKATPAAGSKQPSFSWTLINPIDHFRLINLSQQMSLEVPSTLTASILSAWLLWPIAASVWLLRRKDL